MQHFIQNMNFSSFSYVQKFWKQSYDSNSQQVFLKKEVIINQWNQDLQTILYLVDHFHCYILILFMFSHISKEMVIRS